MGPGRVLVVTLFACGLAACETPGVGSVDLDSVMVCPAGSTVQGVDVSAEAVDWQAFAAGGWDFGIAKASEGVTFVESQFATNWPQMKAAGVVRGAYCYFHPRPDDPVKEADFFVDTVNKAGGFEPGDIPALDLETLDNDTAAQVAADALAWLARVKADTGITPIIYTSPRVFDTLLGSPSGFSGYPLWDVTWNGGPPNCPNIPASWSGWAFWQYAGDSITAPGLPGSANDGDVFNGTHADLLSFTSSLADVPTDAGGDGGFAGPDGGFAGPDAGFAGPDAGPGYANNGDLIGGCNAAGRSSADPPILLLLALAGLLRPWKSRRRASARRAAA